MANLFGVDIAAIIDGALSAGLLPLTLEHTVPGARTPGDPTSGTNPTTTTHEGRGIQDMYRDAEIDGTLVLRGDRKILVITNSLTPAVVPQVGDYITIEGSRFILVNDIGRDPAAATFLCQGRNA